MKIEFKWKLSKSNAHGLERKFQGHRSSPLLIAFKKDITNNFKKKQDIYNIKKKTHKSFIIPKKNNFNTQQKHYINKMETQDMTIKE